MSPQALAAALSQPQAPAVLDVREPWEWELCHLPGAVHIPLATLPGRVGELDTARPLVVMCHHGARSYQAAVWLARRGFTRVANLDGGIDAWALGVDPAVPTY